MVNERTPLRKGPSPPPYVFMTNPNKVYRKQVRQFQCCICMALLASFISALVLTILYSVENDVIDNPPVMPGDNTSLNTLLSMSFPLPDSRPPTWNMSSISVEDLTSAIAEGKTSLEARDKIEAMNPGISISNPSYRHQQSVKTSARASYLARSAYVLDVATKTIVRKQKSSGKTPLGRGPVLNSDWLPKEECENGPVPACPPSAYRTVDGSCNNPYKPNEWGVAMRPFRRQLPADYADGISSPRVASDGSSLPPARDVSNTVHRPTYRDDPKFTVMLAVWGQFLDHDITATALTIGAGGKALSCCNTTLIHPECYPVTLSENDNYYKQYGVTCMEFIRSAPAPTCALGPREQLNQVSSYIDASVVYGNTPELSRALRTFQGGKLKMSLSTDGRELLPISTNPKDGCNREEENAEGRYCFMAGDVRANENLHLTSIHLLMARQHNTLAQKLGTLNPEWSDEQIYQEARKIVYAQMQHVTYNEFLPVLLGPDIMDQLELSPKQTGYYNGYNASVDPTISNSFATSSFRFAHTLLPGLMKVLASDTSSEEFVELHKMLFNPYSLYKPGYLDMALRGAINTKVTQRLFERSDEKSKPEAPKYGLDLVSLNVQRGRDHGLPSYPEWRQYCGFSKPETFKDLDGHLDKGSLDKIKAIYKSVNDIDVYTGALSEIPIEGGMLGPTVTCLITDQFKRLKDGDSFWYETPQKPQGFTIDQLNEIRKTSLAKIICDTSDAVTTAQPKVMESVQPGNERISCSGLPEMDLTKWASISSESAVPPYSKVGVTVTGGNIVTNNGVSVWNGALPVVIPLPLLDSGKTFSSNENIFYDHEIQWTGTISNTNGGIIMKGLFSLSTNAHTIPSVTNISVSWINGEFTFNSKILWNSSNVDALVLSGSYSSPVFLSEGKDIPMQSSTERFVIVKARDDLPSVLGDVKSPIILKGVYSADKKIFYWSGDAIITIPNTDISIPNDIQKLSASAVVETEEKNGTGGGFSVIAGSIKASNSDGSTSLLWSGELPAEIPLPEFYNIASSDDRIKSLVFASGVVWSTSISESMLEGDFSFPLFYNLNNFSIKWTQGVFAFNVLPLWNISLDEILTPGVKYTSRIILHEYKPMLKTVNSMLDDKYNSSILEKFVVNSQEVIDGTVPVPLILFGTFSSDKSIFYWSGDIIVTVRKSKDKIEQQMTKLRSAELDFGVWSADRFGGMVETGYLTAGLNNENPKAVWTGNFPVSIPIPEFYSPVSFLYAPGITWSGSLLGSTLQGTYKMQQILWNSLIPTVQTWSGEFSFQINPLWNTPLDTLFVPGAKYYSKLNFQNVGDFTYAPINNVSLMDRVDEKSELYAPIILQGTHSLDKKSFLWSGNFIISFRNGISLFYTASPPKQKNLMNKLKSEKSDSLNLTITAGRVFAGPTGQTQKQVWSGKFPTTIPLDPITPSNNFGKITVANVMWSGNVMNDTIVGTFSIPTYLQSGTDELQWWSGNFSFKYSSQNAEAIQKLVSSEEKYNFKVLFRHLDYLYSGSLEKELKTKPIVNLVMDAQDVLDDTVSGKLALIGDFYSKPFYCSILPFCSDKNEFYWSGDAFIGFNKNIIKKLSMIKYSSVGFIPQFSQQFGGKVTSGNIQAGVENVSPNIWWSGVLPVTIPLSALYSPGETPGSGTRINLGITWSGSSLGGKVTGMFSFPQYVWNGISKKVQWWNGKLNFQIEPLWNITLDRLISSGVKYYSEIHFKSMKVPVTESNSGIKSETFGDNGVTPMMYAPVVLQGSYTPDHSAFIWNGDFIISFKNRPAVFGTMNNVRKQIENLKKTDDDVSKDKVKPIKPPKPPKLSVSFTLDGGNVFASKENETGGINIWSGEVPVRLNIDRFAKPGGWSLSADVTWKADQVTPVLSGQFAIPTYTKNNSLYVKDMWYGNFTLKTETKYGATFEVAVKPEKTYSCRIFFKTPTKLNSMVVDTTPESVSPDSGELGEGAPCNLLLIGSSVTPPIYCRLLPFLCTESNLFDWNGQGFISFPLPKPQINTVQEKLEVININMGVTGNELGSRKQVFATVLSGNLVGSRESEYPRILWSGSPPAEIPLPVFWTTDAIDVPDDPQVYGHGVVWSGSQLGMFFEGYFSLPQYAWNGITSSVQWWNGRFSFLLEPLFNSDLDGLIVRGVKYKSRIVFQDSKYTTNLLTSPSQDDINNALHVPIVLQGSYSSDRKIFYWNGKVIIEFHARPNPFYPRQYAANSLNFVQGDNIKATDRVVVKRNLDVVVTSVHISETINKNTTLNLPIVISLNNLSNKTTGTNKIMIDWTATAVTDTHVSGNFTLPTYIPAGENFTVVPLSASFSLDLLTLFNTSTDAIQPGMKYSSIVIFQSSKKMDYGNLQFPTTEATRSKSSIILLTGSLSPDKMFFTWTGQAWLKFSSTISESKNLTFKLGDKKNLTFKLGKNNNLQTQSTAGGKKSVGIVVTSGNISGTINGDTKSWFAGTTPVVIPLYLLSAKSSEHVVNLEWRATEVSPHLTGHFSFPMNSPDNSNFTIEWVSGIFSFKVTTLWSTKLDVIQPGVKYSTLLLFKDKSQQQSLPSEDSLKKLIMDSDLNDSQLGTISLTGTFSPDGMYFIWTGEAWVNFKTNSYTSELKFTSSEEVDCSKYGGAVVAGRITANSFEGPQTYWSGDLPVALSVDTFYPSYKAPHGLLWSATGSDSLLKGRFYFPKPVSSDVLWLTGDFEFQLRPLWDCSITELIQPDVKYYSKINFQGLSSKFMNKKALWTGEDFDKAQNSSVTLQGSFSPDRSIFFWSGNFIFDLFTH